MHAGVDQSVSVVLALLLCCYTEAEPGTWRVLQKKLADKRRQPFQAQTSHKLSDPQASISPDRHSEAAAVARKAMASSSSNGHVEERNTIYKKVRSMLGPDDAARRKAQLRRCLAFVSSFYPAACPSRGSLRQVFNFVLADSVAGFGSHDRDFSEAV